MAEFDVLIAGEINPDLILAGDVTPAFGQLERRVGSAKLTIGSSSAICACGMAGLGLRTAFVGVCGADLFGRFMLEAMEARGVDTRAVIVNGDQRTGISVILNRGEDRAILTYPGCMGALFAEQIGDTLLMRTRHLHVSSYFLQPGLQPGLPALFRRARELGLTTSLDTNWDPAEEWESVKEVLPDTCVFLPNAAEACAIARTPDVGVAAADLAQLVETVAVKLGANGALAVQHGKTMRVPVMPARVVDTVGAGDAFDAGFLYGYLSGWELERALRMAVVCGSLSTQAAGGVDAQPTAEDALRLLDSWSENDGPRKRDRS
jgi:sugar/nucleoside kinase (ribokinase family)